jgi:hypothetical protein
MAAPSVRSLNASIRIIVCSQSVCEYSSTGTIPVYESVADALPTIDSEDNHWIKNALRAIYLQESDQNKTTASDALERIKEEFIEAQLRYHENILLKRRELAANYLSSRARIGLSCFILCVMLIAINTFSEAFLHIGIDGMAHHFLIIITLASLSFWAANKKLDNFGLESEIRRAKAMVAAFKNVQVFLRAQDSLQNDVNTDQITYAAILSIGRVFILDQANWHALHHERPVELRPEADIQLCLFDEALSQRCLRLHMQ